MTKQHAFTAAMALSVLLLTGPAVAGQASMLDASEASGFMGTWVISMEAPRGGTFDQTVTVRDEGGKVATRLVGVSTTPTTSPISPSSLSGFA